MEIFVLRNGEQVGPFSEETVQSQLKRGGLLSTDNAWRKGLPAWIPLGELLSVGSSETPPAPTNESGVRNVAAKKEVTPKQRALLKYLGATFAEDVTYEEAAVAISKALESPKLTMRFTKWGEEKLRLHPVLFQDEIDYRRTNRVSFYLDLCHTEGAKAVKDVTKAHVQVIIEALDKMNASWEVDSRAALWDHLLPTVAEHFPQLVREEWKRKLKHGAKSKNIEALEDEDVIVPAPTPPSAMQSVIRGVLYGLIVLGVAFGTMKLYQATLPPKPVVAAVVPPAAAPVAPPLPAEPAPVANPAGDPPPNGDAPNIAAPVVDLIPVPPAPVAPAPEMPVAENPAVPAAPMAPDVPAPVAPAAPKSVLTITKPVTVQLQFGRVTLSIGTRVRFIATEGQNVRVNFNNNVILVPSAATDVDAPAPAAPPAAPAAAPSAIPALPPIPPAPKPASDL